MVSLELSSSELANLESAIHSSDSNISRRARIIHLAASGMDVDDIATELKVTTRTVKRWLKEFGESRMDIFPDSYDTPSPMTVLQLCEKHDVYMPHARHVGEIATELFDITQPIHSLSDEYRTTAHNAGLLHDIAFATGQAQHHTRGHDIILAEPITDLPDPARQIVAVATTFHRKRWKDSRLEDEPTYSDLPDDLQPVAWAISAILRIADGIDYSHSQSTLISGSQVDENGVTITLAGPNVHVDADRANYKADMWRAILKVPISLLPFDNERTGDDHTQTILSLPDEDPIYLQPITPADPMSEAGRKILGRQFQVMMANLDGTRLGEDPEALHDMRVAARRMRTTFKLIGRYYDKPVRRHLRKGLARTTRALGRVRDLDVLMLNFEKYLGQRPDIKPTDLNAVRWRWNKKYQKARTQMLAYLDSDKFQDWAGDFKEFVTTSHQAARRWKSKDRPRPILVRHILPRLIHECFEQVRAYDTAIMANAPVETLHALRIDTKRLRYTLEFFQEILGPAADELITIAVDLQNILGALNDAHVASRFVRKTLDKANRRVRKLARRYGHAAHLPDTSATDDYLDYLDEQMAQCYGELPAAYEALTRREARLMIGSSIAEI